MWSFEGPPSLDEKLDKLQHELLDIDVIIHHGNIFHHKLMDEVQCMWNTCSYRLVSLSKNQESKYYLKKRLQKMMKNNPDFENKYRYALSNVNASSYVCESLRKTGLQLSEGISKMLAYMKGVSSLADCAVVKLGTQSNAYPLANPENMPACIDLDENPRFVKQRSKLWFKQRKMARLTGSTANDALGLRSLQCQNDHIGQFIKGRPAAPFTEDVQRKIDFGVKNEINGIAGICARLLCGLEQNCMAFIEVGQFFIHGAFRDNLIEVSPDGLLECSEGDLCPSAGKCQNRRIAVEIKCHLNDEEELDHPRYELPWYYVCQCLLNMHVLEATELWFVSCTKKSTSLIVVTYSKPLFDKLLDLAEELYSPNRVPDVKKLHPTSRQLRKEVREFVQTNSRFVLEIPTIHGVHGEMAVGVNAYGMIPETLLNEVDEPEVSRRCEHLMTDLKTWMEEVHRHMREPATELGVFMLSDSDRIFHPQQANNLPVGYIMKGNSLKTPTFRKIVNKLRNSLKDAGLSVIGEVYDGEWSSYVFNADDGFPLTRLGLQKRSWNKFKNLGKKKCLQYVTDSCATDNEAIQMIKPDELRETFVLDVGNCRVQLIRNTLHLSSLGGDETHLSIMGNNLQVDTTPERWDNTGEDETKPIKRRKQLYGLQGDESSMLALVGKEVRDEILGIPEEDNIGEMVEDSTNESVRLETYLSSDSIQILDDILNELQEFDSRWDYLKVTDLFPGLLNDAESLKKFRKSDLTVIGNVLFYYTRRKWINQGMRKAEMCNSIASAFGGQDFLPVESRDVKVKKVALASLKTLCAQVVMEESSSTTAKFPVQFLRASLATALHEKNLVLWEKRSKVTTSFVVPPYNYHHDLFATPDYNEERDQIECKLLDSSHMLSNLRTSVLKRDGFTIAPASAWRKIADHHPDILSRAIVYDNIDAQSTSFSKRVFSKAVEDQMKRNKDYMAMKFCRITREWFQSVDARGIKCANRVSHWMNMHEMLTSGEKFNSFPPTTCGRYIKGIPHVTYQGILQGISMRIVQFGLCKKGTYCQRQDSTLNCESFFCDFVYLDKEGLGTIKSVNVPRLMGKVQQLNFWKHKPEK